MIEYAPHLIIHILSDTNIITIKWKMAYILILTLMQRYLILKNEASL